MNRVFTLLISLMCLAASAQDPFDGYGLPLKDGQPYFQVIDSSSASASREKIYLAAKIMLSDVFTSAPAVIQVEDKDGGVLVGKGKMRISHKLALGVNEETMISFVFSIQAKDGRYRIQVYDFECKGSTASKFEPIINYTRYYGRAVRERFFMAFKSSTEALINQMRSKISEKMSQDQW